MTNLLPSLSGLLRDSLFQGGEDDAVPASILNPPAPGGSAPGGPGSAPGSPVGVGGAPQGAAPSTPPVGPAGPELREAEQSQLFEEDYLADFAQVSRGDFSQQEKNRGAKLSADQKREVRQTFLLTTGLTMMAASFGTHGETPTMGKSLMIGLLAGRQAALTKEGALLDERKAQARAARYMAVFDEGVNRGTIEQAFKIALSNDDQDSADVLKDMLKNYPTGDKGDMQIVSVQTADGPRSFWVNPSRPGELFDAFTMQRTMVAPSPTVSEDTFTKKIVVEGELHEVLFNKSTGDVIRDLGPAELSGEGRTLKDVEASANALADDFIREAAPLQEAALQASLSDTVGDNAAGDLALIFIFNKVIDPGSRVTEGEVQAGKNLGGLSTQARFFYDRLVNGRLPPTERANIKEQIRVMAEKRAEMLESTRSRFAARARAAGVNVDFVMNPDVLDPPVGVPAGGVVDVDAELDELFGGGN